MDYQLKLYTVIMVMYKSTFYGTQMPLHHQIRVARNPEEATAIATQSDNVQNHLAEGYSVLLCNVFELNQIALLEDIRLINNL
jgi:hypothetical protein